MSGEPEFPMCGQCHRFVEKLHMTRSLYTLERVYVAECHGAIEEVRIDDRVIEAMPVRRLRFGTAFATPKLTASRSATDAAGVEIESTARADTSDAGDLATDQLSPAKATEEGDVDVT